MSMIPGGTGTAASFPDGIIGSQRANVQTISSTLVLTSSSNRLQLITPSGATRTVQLPTTSINQGEEWVVMNSAGSGQGLVVAASNGSTIVTLAAGETSRLVAGVATPIASSDWKVQTDTAGTGSSGINYIENPLFDDGTVTGWATYADAAGTTPVDGTGGSPNVTFTAVSGATVRGTYAARLTKDAANRQGQGASYAFSIDAADTGRPVSIAFDFLSGGSYAANDVGVYVYDVTNATLITPAAVNVAAGKGTFRAFFVATTSTSYRLILHVASTNASAWTLDTDNFQVGPQVQLAGAAVTDWQDYTGTAINGGSASFTYAARRYRRVGDSAEIEFIFSTTAGSGTGDVGIPLPPSLQLDLSKVTNDGINGFYQLYTGTVYAYGGGVRRLSSDAAYVYLTRSSSAATVKGADLVGGAQYYTRFTVPIVGWSSNVTMAERAVEEYASNSSTTDADDTTSFVNGAEGSVGVLNTTALTTTRAKRVRFQTPIQATDSLVLEFRAGSGRPWLPWTATDAGSLAFQIQNAGRYGVFFASVTGSTTDVDVFFATDSRPTGATYGASGEDWNAATFANWRWRLRKVSGGAAVGYPVSGKNVIPEYVVLPAINSSTTINFGIGIRFVNSGSPTTQTLQAVTATDSGKAIYIKNTGVGTVTVQGSGGALIDGAATLTLSTYESAQVVTDGTNWFII